MDQAVRNKLRNVVTQCRKLLEDAITQSLQGQFGIYAGKKSELHVEGESRMAHLSEEDQGCRRDLLDHLEHIKARGYKPKFALEQLIREIAFTHLNRLCAYKMMEAREVYVGGKKFREAVSRGINSNGFKFYLADHPEDERLFNTGNQDVAYRHFLDWLGGLLSEEIGVLFNPNDPANRLYPPQRVLDEVLELLNGGDIRADEQDFRTAWSDIWGHDETIGWVFQYFTPKEIRDQARRESQSPRNSYELAFRNQFFTPRYVVEFLTDNALGRIWYEMREGHTKLSDQCRYMVRSADEVPNRPKRDPRDLKILDPACGSGHFLLYCFDILKTIYEEAYEDSDLGPALRDRYPTLDDLQRAVPGLILGANLYGIDIDPRATQIAALALWLRSQRDFQEIGLHVDRPCITQTNLVCAEPMPGERRMLEEFVEELEPKLLGQLVEEVFSRMSLAGEAGSLLKIEEEIQAGVSAAREQWEAGPVMVQLTLFDGEEPKQEQRFDLSGIDDNDFFEHAESRVLEALERYSARAEHEKRLQRRLFGDDAMRGFAFIDCCRQRYDAVLMNPPFGDPSKPSQKYLERQFSRTKHDVYSAFVERGLNWLRPRGRLGAITSRTGFFLVSFQKWRQDILLRYSSLKVLADLGTGVLDTALVETAAYCLERPARPTDESKSHFFRLLESAEKGDTLLQCVRSATLEGIPKPPVFVVDPSSFDEIPCSTFAYWVSDSVRRLFTEFSAFERNGRHACVTNPAGDDQRYFRCWWEVPPSLLVNRRRWVSLCKGGDFSRFYSDTHLVADWDDQEGTFRGFEGTVHRPLKRPASADWFFRPGLTYSTRTQLGFSARVLPAESIFHAKGPGVFVEESERYACLGIMNSAVFKGLLELQMAFGSYEVGVIQRTPVPELGSPTATKLGEVTRRCVEVKQRLDTVDETTHVFEAPALLPRLGDSLSAASSARDALLRVEAATLSDGQKSINDFAGALYGISAEDMRALTEEGGDDDASIIEKEIEPDSASPRRLAADLVLYGVGVAVGRWDVRMVIGEPQAQDLPDPFAPLPACSPGMLQGDSGFPAESIPKHYPLEVDWDGILPEDPQHQDDVVRRVRGILELVWAERHDAIERQIRDGLGVRSLREYFRKPGKGGVWDDHVKRYSKSRRKAPIYWLLQSSKKSYALWLYYHRLDKDILFKALLNYVEPKIRLEEGRLEPLRAKRVEAGAGGKGAKKVEREIDRQEEFVSELKDFEEKLRRVANLHLEPDLNDGVVLNIAPLWELVPWREAKKYWDQLMDGKYEWSSIGKQLREKGLVKD